MKPIIFQTVRHETPSCKTITHVYVRDNYNVTQTIEVMKHGTFKKFDACVHSADIVTYLDSTNKEMDILIKEFVCYKHSNDIYDL